MTKYHRVNLSDSRRIRISNDWSIKPHIVNKLFVNTRKGVKNASALCSTNPNELYATVYKVGREYCAWIMKYIGDGLFYHSGLDENIKYSDIGTIDIFPDKLCEHEFDKEKFEKISAKKYEERSDEEENYYHEIVYGGIKPNFEFHKDSHFEEVSIEDIIAGKYPIALAVDRDINFTGKENKCKWGCGMFCTCIDNPNSNALFKYLKGRTKLVWDSEPLYVKAL